MIIRTREDLHLALTFIAQNDTLSYDIETSGLNPRRDTMIGFGCANLAGNAFYIIMKEFRQSESGGYLAQILSYEDVLPVLEALQGKKLITHNGSFDTRFTLCQTGVELAPSLYADTMLLSHILDENRWTHGLKQLGAEIFGADVTAEQSDMKESIKANGGTPNELYKANSEKIARYGLQDVKLTCRLYKHFMPLLERDGLTKFFFEETMPTYKYVCIPMEYSGVNVDVDFLQKSHEEISASIQSYEDSIQSAIKPLLHFYEDWYIRTKFAFKLTGPSRQKLAEIVGAPEGWPRTDKGAYSFSKADIAKAQKKGLLAPDTPLERYTVSQLDRVPEDLQRSVQLALLADEGTKYIFNINSKDCLKRLFFGTSTTPSPLQETPLSKTDKGSPQVDNEFLEEMAKKYTWAADLIIFNKLQKLSGTYITRVLEEQENGIFYPQFHMHRTVSGRMSGDFQQLPRPLEEGQDHPDVINFTNRIRKFFIAPPGYIFADSDYNSLEPRTFAHVSNDPALKAIFEKDLDFYSEICIRTEKLQQYSADKKAENYLGKVAKSKRQTAKAYALGLYYGMTDYKLHFEIQVLPSEAAKLVQGYWSGFPELKKSFDGAREFALKHGFVRTEAGRIRRFPRLKQLYGKYGKIALDSLELYKEFSEMPGLYEQAKSDASYIKNSLNNAVNFKIQGLGASIINRASVNIAKELLEKNLDARICSQVHDQLIILCREDLKEEVGAIIQFHMENTYKISVPLIAEPSYGRDMQESKG